MARLHARVITRGGGKSLFAASDVQVTMEAEKHLEVLLL